MDKQPVVRPIYVPGKNDIENERCFRYRLEAISAGVIIQDHEGKVIFANRAACSLFELDCDKLVGTTPFDSEWHIFYEDGAIFPPEELPSVVAIRTGKPIKNTLIVQFPNKPSKKCWFIVEAKPILNPDNTVAEVVITYDDITEEKRAQELLRLNEERLEALVKLYQMGNASLHEITDYALEAGVKLTKSKAGYLAFADENEQMFIMHSWSGGALEECQVKGMPIRYSIESMGLWGEAVRQRKPIITNDYSAPNPYKKGMPKGHVKLTRHMNVPVFDGDKIVAVAGVGNKDENYDESDVRQLTLLMNGMWSLLQRQHSEQIQRDAERRLADIINFLPDPTFAIDLDGKVIIWNHATEQLTGVKAEDMIGKGDFEYAVPFYGSKIPMLISLVLHPELEEKHPYPFIDKKNGKLMAETRTQAIRPEGAVIWGMATPLYDSQGNVVGAIESVRDITDRKKSEQALKEQKELLQLVMDNIPQYIFWKDRNSVYMGCNRSYSNAIHLESPAEIVGKTDFDLTEDKNEAELYRASDLRVIEMNTPLLHVVERRRMPDNRQVWLDTNKVPLHSEEGNVVGVLGVYEDITQRKMAEEELKERREREQQIQAEAEAAKREFYKGTIFSVTDGKLNLIGYDEMRSILAPNAQQLPLQSSSDFSALREAVETTARAAALSPDRVYELVTAVGEAAANAIKHANGGTAWVASKNGTIQASVQDKGAGMDALILPKATLMKRYSTRPSMGLGYSLILTLVDRVYLATESQGTWVLMEMSVEEPRTEMSIDNLPDTW